jgi:hypothetical protein
LIFITDPPTNWSKASTGNTDFFAPDPISLKQSEGFNFASDELHTSAVAARMRKLTIQEDTVPESIISMPKTPYIR